MPCFNKWHYLNHGWQRLWSEKNVGHAEGITCLVIFFLSNINVMYYKLSYTCLIKVPFWSAISLETHIYSRQWFYTNHNNCYCTSLIRFRKVFVIFVAACEWGLGSIYLPLTTWIGPLTHWGRDQIDAISQTIFIYTSIGSDNGLAPTRLQAIVWTNDG